MNMKAVGLRFLILLVMTGIFPLIYGVQKEVIIRMMPGVMHGIPPKDTMDPRSRGRRSVFEKFRQLNPDIRIVHAGGLEIKKGTASESGFLMSMAGETAPDIFYVNFRQYYSYIGQGFCRPLDDFIAKDPEMLKIIHPKVLEVLKSYDGKIYAFPWYQVAQALFYRKDHFIDAGLDPSKPPRDWDEFYHYGQRIVESNPGRSAFAFNADVGSKAYYWSNFVWQAGGDIVTRSNDGQWKCVIGTPQAAKALDFYRKMNLDKWRSSNNGKLVGPMARVTATLQQDITDGKVSMWYSYTNDVALASLTSDVNPQLIGIAQMPAGPAGHANEVNAGMWAINSTIKDPRKVEACWRFIKYFASDEAARINTEQFVELGLASLINPICLKKFGYEDLASSVDPSFLKANQELFKTGHPEPYGRNCQQVYKILDEALDRSLIQPTVPSLTILQDVEKRIDDTLLAYTPPAQMEKKRAWAYGIFSALTLCAVGVAVPSARRLRGRGVRSVSERLGAGANRRSIYKFVFLCIFPAALSIAVWSYYPLFRGLGIAFQDYKILGGSKWAGLDNFIEAFTQPLFYKSIINSFLFVGLSILIGFFLPIFLALALSEVRRFRGLLSMVFYLPAMTSPIIITVLWAQFYDPSETGLLNRMLSPFIDGLNWFAMTFLGSGSPPIDKALNWLGNPSLAMFAVVLPGIWAAVGPGSILYLAALKNVPSERYEAADLDGANWVQKIRYLTLPSLKPLILINLLGVFIAGFKSMENIFVLTGGGPLNATHTMGLEIWTNAFMFLRFGYATAVAWVMGAILVGFTLLQIKGLLRMRFTRSGL